MMMDTARTASSSVDEMMTTALLLDGALSDMVAVSTPRTVTAADGEEGVSQTVRRAESHSQDDLNLWWSVDAGYLLDADVKKKAVVVMGSVEEDKEEEVVEVSRRLLVAPPPAPSSPAVTIGVEEEEEKAINVSASGGAEEEEAATPAAAKQIRLFAYCSAAPQQKNWAGAVPAKKERRAPKKTIKKMRVALPVGDGDSATLAHGALVYGMVGGKHEERCRLIAAARELRCAPEVWAREIEETLNDLIPKDAPLLSFGSHCGANDDLDLRNTGKGVTKHAVAIMAALDHLRDLENAIKAAARGILVRWPECLPRAVQRCVALHPYLDAWVAASLSRVAT
jgi:hypothetical protein